MSQVIGTLSQVGLVGGAAILGMGGTVAFIVGGFASYWVYSDWATLTRREKTAIIVGALACSIIGLSLSYTTALVGRVAVLGVGSLNEVLKPVAIALISGLVLGIANKAFVRT